MVLRDRVLIFSLIKAAWTLWYQPPVLYSNPIQSLTLVFQTGAMWYLEERCLSAWYGEPMLSWGHLRPGSRETDIPGGRHCPSPLCPWGSHPHPPLTLLPSAPQQLGLVLWHSGCFLASWLCVPSASPHGGGGARGVGGEPPPGFSSLGSWAGCTWTSWRPWSTPGLSQFPVTPLGSPLLVVLLERETHPLPLGLGVSLSYHARWNDWAGPGVTFPRLQARDWAMVEGCTSHMVHGRLRATIWPGCVCCCSLTYSSY